MTAYNYKLHPPKIQIFVLFLASVRQLWKASRQNTPYIQVDRVSPPPAGYLAMGGSSSKTHFIWKKKKKSPLKKAWRQLKGALPHKKRKKKIPLSLDKLSLDNLKRKKRPQRKFSLPTDKKEFISSKRLSLGNMRKENVGEQIKKRLSLPVWRTKMRQVDWKIKQQCLKGDSMRSKANLEKETWIWQEDERHAVSKRPQESQRDTCIQSFNDVTVSYWGQIIKKLKHSAIHNINIKLL